MKKNMWITFAVMLLFTTVSAQLPDPQQVISAKIEANEIKIIYKIPEGFHQTLQKDMFFIEVDEVEEITFEPTVYPEGKKMEDGSIEFHGTVILTKKFTISENFTGNPLIQVYAGYQFCNESGTCFMPEEVKFSLSLSADVEVLKKEKVEEIHENVEATDNIDKIIILLDDFEITGIAAGYQNSEGFASFLENSKEQGLFNTNKFANMSIWLIIILILLGGIALNLTPCVLPMMPITIAVLGAGTQSESKAKGFLIGGIYGLGMALAYGLLGVIVVLTGSQFGTINSSPWFNIAIATLFIVLALAMFDIIPIDFSKFQSNKIGGKSKGKYITVFILGVIAAVLAGACVAPVLISVIIYSTSLYTAGNPAGLLLPFLLGIGMAIPWPFAGAGLSFLPKPGNWMKWVKIIFGIIILVIAIFYIYTSVKIFKSNKPVEIGEYSHETSILPWKHSLTEGLLEAKKTGKPVFIDFWATWCKNCLAMDATTFKDEKVIEEFDNYILVKYKAENLKASPTKEILKHFEIIGLPTYITLFPKDK
ncbi:MAG: cytochrome c biogenesis protein CcdA [Candidatus Tenebribacter burtonii]|nr:cytochrome c biogenesis protein CcdA [Candidatus Tenebribacter burtonii]